MSDRELREIEVAPLPLPAIWKKNFVPTRGDQIWPHNTGTNHRQWVSIHGTLFRSPPVSNGEIL
jgi:hypothetical protein